MPELELLTYRRWRLADLLNIQPYMDEARVWLRKHGKEIRHKKDLTGMAVETATPAKVGPPQKPRPGQRKNFYGWLVFLFSFLLFANTIFNNYNLDDELVTSNHRLTSKGIAAIPEIFSSPYYQDKMGYSFEYRPMVLTSFAIEHQLFGDNPHISHFINILLYAFCCLLLYKVLRLLFKNYAPVVVLGISLLFAAHPAHTEVAGSIKNRDEILGLLFSLMALYSAVKAVQTRRAWLILPVLFFMALALMSKVTVISFALIIPMALMLFSEAGILWLTAITFALLVPAFFLLNMSGGYEKLLTFSAIMATVWMFYILLHYTTLWLRLKTSATGCYHYLFNSNGDADAVFPANRFKPALESILPDKQILALYPILVTTVFTALYIAGIALHYSVAACVPLLLLLLLAGWGEEKTKWWALVMIGVCLTYGLGVRLGDHFNLASDRWYYHLVCLYLSWQAFYGKRGLLLPYLICYAIANYMNITGHHVYTGLYFIMLPVLNFKYLRLIIILLFAGSEIYMVAKGTEGFFNLLNFACSLVVLLSIHFHKTTGRWILLLVCPAFIVFHLYGHQLDHNYSSRQSIITTIAMASERANPKIMAVTQYRPLGFMEECVSHDSSFSVRAGTSLEILFHYLHHVVLPYPMSFYYGYKFILLQRLTETVPVISLISYALLALLGLALFRRHRLIAFGIFVYLVSVLVFSNYLQPVPGMVAERFLLIPSLGWCIVLAGLMQKIWKIEQPFTGYKPLILPARAKYVFMGILLLYSGITFARNFNWKDDLTLFRHDINYVPQSAQAHNLLALHLMFHAESETDLNQKAEMQKEALLHFKKAQQIYPTFFNIAYDIGRVYNSLNQPDSAIAAFQYAVTLDTTFPDAYLRLGTLEVVRSRFEAAAPYLERVVRLKPAELEGYELLSYCYFRLNQLDKSIAVNQIAVRQIPGTPFPLINIAKTFIAKNQPDSARIYLIRANSMAPGNPQVQQLLLQTGK